MSTGWIGQEGWLRNAPVVLHYLDSNLPLLFTIFGCSIVLLLIWYLICIGPFQFGFDRRVVIRDNRIDNVLQFACHRDTVMSQTAFGSMLPDDPVAVVVRLC
jgi:hypothetical protein